MYFCMKSYVSKRGFTIGEVVLSAFMLTAGMTVVLKLINFSFQSTVATQDVIVASELAQEGIELVRNARDNNLVKKVAGDPSVTSVFDGFPPGFGPRRCIIDYLSDMPNCPAGGLRPELNLSGGFYRHGVGPGRYYRQVRLDRTAAAGSDTFTVTSFVTWQDIASLPNPMAAAKTWCTLTNKCVYTEVLLTEWQ